MMLLLSLSLALAVSAAQAQPPLDPVVAKLREAQALMTGGKYEQALVLLEEAKTLGGRPAMVALNLAKAHAHVGNADAAFQELTRAAGFGLGALPPPFDTDADLARLRSDARFAEVEKALDRNARPCEHDPVYRQFDYWVGTWDVRANGSPNAPPATNVITKIHQGCVVLESWTAPGQTGQSFNIYDRVEKKWHQTWVDSSGGLHEYWGQPDKDGNMVYEGDIPVPPNQGTGRMHVRLTFFRRPDGSVRQYSERTMDGGKTWQVNYDLVYTKRK
jgi:hypothetical protein